MAVDPLPLQQFIGAPGEGHGEEQVGLGVGVVVALGQQQARRGVPLVFGVVELVVELVLDLEPDLVAAVAEVVRRGATGVGLNAKGVVDERALGAGELTRGRGVEDADEAPLQRDGLLGLEDVEGRVGAVDQITDTARCRVLDRQPVAPGTKFVRRTKAPFSS